MDYAKEGGGGQGQEYSLKKCYKQIWFIIHWRTILVLMLYANKGESLIDEMYNRS